MNLALFTEDKNKFLHILKELENVDGIGDIFLFSTSSLENKEVSFNNKTLKIININDFYDFDCINYCIFDVNRELTDKYIYNFIENDCVVLNASSNFIDDSSIPLVVFDINKKDVVKYENKNIINLPSASSLQLNIILNILKKRNKIKRVVVSTYQSASYLGKDAMDELFNHTKKIYENSFLPPVNFTKQIPFNILPQVGYYCHNNFYEDEYRIIKESNIINKIDVSATCAIVPTFTCCCQAVNIEFENKPNDIKKILEKHQDKITIIDEPQDYRYATPKETSMESNIFVSRIRKSSENIVDLWTVADNLVLFAKNVVNIIKFLLAK